MFDLIKGLRTTAKYLFQKPVTISYPEVKRPVRERFRGRTSSSATRTAWSAASAARCARPPARPTRSMSSRPRTTRPIRSGYGERYAAKYEINMLRCIFCGYCEDACPTNAIVLEHEYELSFYDRKSAIYTKEMLLVPADKGYGRAAADPAAT